MYQRSPHRPSIRGEITQKADISTACIDTQMKFIEKQSNAGAICFSESPETSIPDELEFIKKNVPNPIYVVRDAKKLFHRLETSPSSIQLDCLNIIPITIFYTLASVLVQQGYSSDEVSKLFNGAYIEGNHSYIKIRDSERRLAPWWFNENLPANVTNFSTSLRVSGIAYTFANQTDGGGRYIAGGKLSGVDIKKGDILTMGNVGASGSPKYGNSDDQNGFFLSSHQGDVLCEKIKVFGHTAEVSTRCTTFSAVAENLSKRAVAVHKLNFQDYLEKGSVGFSIIRLDYQGLFDALVKELENQHESP